MTDQEASRQGSKPVLRARHILAWGTDGSPLLYLGRSKGLHRRGSRGWGCGRSEEETLLTAGTSEGLSEALPRTQRPLVCCSMEGF